MALTAMRPDLGLLNGREVFPYKDSQAAASISAFRIVFRDL